MMGRYARIMADLEDGIDFKTIAKKYGTDKATISVYNKARTHTLAVYIPPAPSQESRPEAELPIVDLYRAGHDIETIARMKHINVQAVSWELEVARVTKRGTWTVHIPTDDEVDQIVAAYTTGEGARSIARRFRMSEFRVRKYLDLRGAQPPPKGIFAMTEEDWAEAGRMYENGVTLGDIAKRYHTAAERLSAGLTKRGVHILTRSEIAYKVHKRRREKASHE